jgi:hypothetical protein
MIVFNLWGAAFGLIAGIAMSLFSHPNDLWMGLLAAGVLGLAIDLAVRFFMPGEDDEGFRAFIRPSSGGHIFFVPVWVLALFLLLVGVANAVSGPR